MLPSEIFESLNTAAGWLPLSHQKYIKGKLTSLFLSLSLSHA